jgi:hypothetical protein
MWLLYRTDVSEELSAYVIRVTRIGEIVITLAVTRNRRTLGRNTNTATRKTAFFIATTVKT